MKITSDSFKRFKINVAKTKIDKKTGQITLLFKVDRGVRVYERVLENLGGGNYGMNYNGNYLNVKIN